MTRLRQHKYQTGRIDGQLFLVYNERRDTISREMRGRAIIAKFTYMITR